MAIERAGEIFFTVTALLLLFTVLCWNEELQIEPEPIVISDPEQIFIIDGELIEGWRIMEEHWDDKDKVIILEEEISEDAKWFIGEQYFTDWPE